MADTELLLLSNSSIHGGSYLEFAFAEIQLFLADCEHIAFVPFARADHDQYTARVETALAPLEVSVIGLHAVTDPVTALAETDALFIGGGNTFRLLKTLQQTGLIDVIRARVETGQLRYMGASAGTNMACPTMRTTNDMPIVQPVSLDALSLIPFQINPHYQDPDPASTHQGETREERIREFLDENDVAVLGLREGSWVRRSGEMLTLGGMTSARLFQRGQEPAEYEPGADLSFLLECSPVFDKPQAITVPGAEPNGSEL
jgi:dipeptidase E